MCNEIFKRVFERRQLEREIPDFLPVTEVIFNVRTWISCERVDRGREADRNRDILRHLGDYLIECWSKLFIHPGLTVTLLYVVERRIYGMVLLLAFDSHTRAGSRARHEQGVIAQLWRRSTSLVSQVSARCLQWYRATSVISLRFALKMIPCVTRQYQLAGLEFLGIGNTGWAAQMRNNRNIEDSLPFFLVSTDGKGVEISDSGNIGIIITVVGRR